MTGTITLHSVDKATANWISEEAQRRRVSIESLVVELIRRGVDVERQAQQLPPYHDLDSLAGTWSETDTAEFVNAISDFEQVDNNLWR